jgi:Mg/Co/Ni transporter MgtE
MALLTTLLAVLGAGLILAALTFVTLLIGVLITSMVALFCGPIVDRLLGEDPAGASG